MSRMDFRKEIAVNTLRRFFGFAVLGALALGLGACSRDKEVESVVAELDSFTTALVGKVKASSTPQAGVEEAQKYFDANGAALKAKLDGLKTVRGFQISEQTKKKLESSFGSNALAVAGLQLEYAMQAGLDQTFRQRLEKLVNDYRGLVVG
jgi:hypothetical protein